VGRGSHRQKNKKTAAFSTSATVRTFAQICETIAPAPAGARVRGLLDRTPTQRPMGLPPVSAKLPFSALPRLPQPPDEYWSASRLYCQSLRFC